jgi:hypothetical protein
MPLLSLIYVSRMTEECGMEELQSILKTSREKNAADDITGMLCYDPTFFLQCLEGPKEVVLALYESILEDSRHTKVVRLDEREIQSRVFGEWRMAFLKAPNIDARILSRFTPGPKFDPYVLEPDQAWELFRELATLASE